MRILTCILAILCAYVGYDIMYGRNGYEKYKETSSKLEEVKKISTVLEKRNELVQEELNDLQQGNMAIEELARSELGLIKKDESFYRVIVPERNNNGQ